MVFGTFDVLHKGHEHFFQQARELASDPYLIVSVARDKNARRIKGKQPLHSERERWSRVGVVPSVDRAVLGATRAYISHIINERPDIIALGYDQFNYVKGLKAALAERGLPVRIKRLKPFQPERYKSSLLKKTLQNKLY